MSLLVVLANCSTGSNLGGQEKKPYLVWQPVIADTAHPDRIQVIPPHTWFYNADTSDYFAWPRVRMEQAYAKIKLAGDLEGEMRRKNMLDILRYLSYSAAFIGGAALGLYIAH